VLVADFTKSFLVGSEKTGLSRFCGLKYKEEDGLGKGKRKGGNYQSTRGDNLSYQAVLEILKDHGSGDKTTNADNNAGEEWGGGKEKL